MAQPKNHSAIVIGGSIAGLLTARVLSDHFEQVTIIERDKVSSSDADPRAGVPQGFHGHALLGRGREIMEELFPGLEADLLDHGTLKLDAGQAAQVRFRTGWAKRAASGIEAVSMSRPLLESRIRAHVLANPRITVLEGYDVLALSANTLATAITGVELRQRGTQVVDTLYADLVVDASGRSTKTPDWLEEMGYERPQETVIDAFVGYSTRWFEMPDTVEYDWNLLWIQPVQPVLPRGGLIVPVEGKRWQVTLYGIGKDYPPTDEAGFMNFARSLASRQLYNAICNATPITPVHGYRNLINRMRHYDKLKHFPEGLIIIGDAYTQFNPTYAQGMTVSALSADALATLLRERNGAFEGLGHEFQKRVAKVLAPAWMMAITEDLGWSATEGGKRNALTRFMHWYTGNLLALIPEDEEVYRAFMPVQHMLKPGTTLFAPRIFGKVIAYTLRQRRQGEQQPAIQVTQELAAVKQ